MYSTRQVAALFDLPETQIRQYARDGVLDPERTNRGAFRFAFRDLVVLRAATTLTSSNISHARVRRTLHRVRHQLIDGQQLTEIRLTSDGHSLVASDGETSWEPESGQVQLALDQPVPVPPVAYLEPTSLPGRETAASSPVPTEEILEADIWFDVARQLEEAMPLESEQAYRRALISNPYHVEAMVNLGRLLHIRGSVMEAVDQYRKALEIDGTSGVAAFNLAVALEELDEPHEAVAAYEMALELQPEMADAHYNLGRLYEGLGERQAALRHWSAYRRLTGSRGR
jgi:DNA-binding transcriptional MerR regulator